MSEGLTSFHKNRSSEKKSFTRTALQIFFLFSYNFTNIGSIRQCTNFDVALCMIFLHFANVHRYLYMFLSLKLAVTEHH